MGKNKNLLTTSGIQVSYADHLENDINLLKGAAKQGYYYPVLAMKQLQSLASGLSGKANVFVPDGLNDSRATSLHMFYAVLGDFTQSPAPRHKLILNVNQVAFDEPIIRPVTASAGYGAAGQETVEGH